MGDGPVLRREEVPDGEFKGRSVRLVQEPSGELDADRMSGAEAGHLVRNPLVEVLDTDIENAEFDSVEHPEDRALHDDSFRAAEADVLGEAEGRHSRQEAVVDLVELEGGPGRCDATVADECQLDATADHPSMERSDRGLGQSFDPDAVSSHLLNPWMSMHLCIPEFSEVDLQRKSGPPPRKTTMAAVDASSRWSQTAVSSRTIRMSMRGWVRVTVATVPLSS